MRTQQTFGNAHQMWITTDAQLDAYQACQNWIPVVEYREGIMPEQNEVGMFVENGEVALRVFYP